VLLLACGSLSVYNGKCTNLLSPFSFLLFVLSRRVQPVGAI
jgi:hypothetical protein